MSDQRWGSREDAAVWWPGGGGASDQNRGGACEDGRNSSGVPAPLFPYKVANFPPSASATPCMRGYPGDYRGVPGRPDGSVPATGWWYPGMDGGMPSMPPATAAAVHQQNQLHQLHQQHQLQQFQQHQLQQQQNQLHQQASQLHQQQQAQQQHQQQQQQQASNHRVQHQQQQVTAPVGKMPRAKADAKPRGRMTAYAFFVQTCREEHKKKHPEENVVFAEFSKKCAERWKTMLDKEKKRFHEMAEKDKKRYELEMKDYKPPKGEKGRGKKRKHMKDPNAPKRSLSAFFWFCNDERPKVKAINPEYGVGDIAKELGRRWSDADPELKSKYEAMAEKDKARYDREMTAYKKKPKPGMGSPVKPPKADSEEDDDVEGDDDEDDDVEDDDE